MDDRVRQTSDPIRSFGSAHWHIGGATRESLQAMEADHRRPPVAPQEMPADEPMYELGDGIPELPGSTTWATM